MKLFDRRSTEQKFWDWFLKNSADLKYIRSGREPVVTELRKQLDKIDRHLMWEKGTLEDGTEDFVLSADGVRALVPVVYRLAEAAPEIPGWRITRFRQPRDPDQLSRSGFTLAATDVFIGPLLSPKGGPNNIQVFLPNLNQENHSALVSIAFLFLDGYLGEERVMKDLGEIHFADRGDQTDPGWIPITELSSRLG